MISSLGAELGKKHHLLCPEINAFHAEVPVKKKEKKIRQINEVYYQITGFPAVRGFWNNLEKNRVTQNSHKLKV